MSSTLSQIIAAKAVAIVRVQQQRDVDHIADCLIESGVKTLEITSNTPGYTAAITRCKQRYPTTLIGAGTITNIKLAQEAINCGADFLVTPNTSKAVIDITRKHKIPILAGAFTPTEIYQAHEWGADLVKVFPCGAVTPDYIRALAQGPFNDIPLVAVGSVNENNAKTWIEAGCVGVGFGGDLTDPIATIDEFAKRKIKITDLIQSIR